MEWCLKYCEGRCWVVGLKKIGGKSVMTSVFFSVSLKWFRDEGRQRRVLHPAPDFLTSTVFISFSIHNWSSILQFHHHLRISSADRLQQWFSQLIFECSIPSSPANLINKLQQWFSSANDPTLRSPPHHPFSPRPSPPRTTWTSMASTPTNK